MIPRSAGPSVPTAEAVSVPRRFEDNQLVRQLVGPHHSFLAKIEAELGVVIHARGNQLHVEGAPPDVERALALLDGLYARLERGEPIGLGEVGAALKTPSAALERAQPAITIRQRRIATRSPRQAEYIEAIDRHDLVFGLGPAGTGKTYLAVAKAVERLVGGQVDRIILSRPAVEAGEQLGFLPGNMRDKVDPYLRPLYDALHDMMPAAQVAKRLESGEIEVAPLAFMRGRTLANAFVILDEAQNTTAVQMKMFLTRLGENAQMVITGDLSQVDLPKGTRSGLRHALDVLRDLEGVAFIHFSEADVVRNPLVARIVRAYERAEVERDVGAQYRRDTATPRRDP